MSAELILAEISPTNEGEKERLNQLAASMGDTDIEKIVVQERAFTNQVAKEIKRLVLHSRRVAEINNKMHREMVRRYAQAAYNFVFRYFNQLNIRGSFKQINILEIIGNDIDAEKAQILNYLVVSSDPIKLALRNCSITRENFGKIFTSFFHVSELDLSGTPLNGGDWTSNAIDGLKELLANKQLTKINLSQTGLSLKDLVDIKELLKNNLTLVEFEIDENDQNKEVVASIKHEMALNKQIALLQARKRNKKLELVDPVTDVTLECIEKMVRNGIALRQVDFKNHMLTETQAKKLEQALLASPNFDKPLSINVGTQEQRMRLNQLIKFNHKINKIMGVSAFENMDAIYMGWGAFLFLTSLSLGLIAGIGSLFAIGITTLVVGSLHVIGKSIYEASFEHDLNKLKTREAWTDQVREQFAIGQRAQHSYREWLTPKAFTPAAYLGYRTKSDKSFLPVVIAEQPAAQAEPQGPRNG